MKPGLKRPEWTDYFLDIAAVILTRSTCLRRRYGAVIVKDHIIVSTGYNGSPRSEENCIDRGTCQRDELGIPAGERYELCSGVHAEQNAIINGDPIKMKGATIYIAGFNADGSPACGAPCLLCRRMIKNAQIETVIYVDADGSKKIIPAKEL
ncbi:MAG TPA: dCMP deaminase family protein [Methylomusa anaerophila]|uniref:Cytidine and deoxycytidylate deaminase zinc-binding region n=1 Tax=Methylomusa anaerophila TaxID=1930071 RepID=A0A348AHK4_9FIRM|nr:dCMP deaminase family protein [Methylomusa anaerophila]BBB90552.1 cytidine and deoxycytidylate deaminase zinc-binding region [Methylomusa anaerophila]HML88842.1 dCMP deaminase family protein [Methylomusa anaerophila]